MDSDLKTIVYCSTSEIKGTDDEIAAGLHDILSAARLKNIELGITGALLYNHGNFAQVLEGHRPLVDRLVRTIHGDPRHRNMTVSFESALTERVFPDWSMAFGAARNHPIIESAMSAVFDGSPHAGEEMIRVLQGLIVKEDDWLL